MSEGIPTTEEVIEPQPIEEEVPATGIGESQENMEAEVEKLQENLSELNDNVEQANAEIAELSEEKLNSNEVQEKLITLKEKLIAFQERHKVITQILVGAGILGVAAMAFAMNTHAGMAGRYIGTHVGSAGDMKMLFDAGGVMAGVSLVGAAINGAISKFGQYIYKRKISSASETDE